MKTIGYFFAASTIALASIGLSSCNNESKNIVGKWTSNAPVNVTDQVAGAASAQVVYTFDFTEPANGTDGAVTMIQDYTISTPVQTDSTVTTATYTASVTFTGTWSKDVDDDDDFLLTFDPSSINVQAQNAPDGLGAVTDAALNSLARFSSIEDVKVSDNGKTLTFEIEKPELKLQFTKQ